MHLFWSTLFLYTLKMAWTIQCRFHHPVYEHIGYLRLFFQLSSTSSPWALLLYTMRKNQLPSPWKCTHRLCCKVFTWCTTHWLSIICNYCASFLLNLFIDSACTHVNAIRALRRPFFVHFSKSRPTPVYAHIQPWKCTRYFPVPVRGCPFIATHSNLNMYTSSPSYVHKKTPLKVYTKALGVQKWQGFQYGLLSEK